MEIAEREERTERPQRDTLLGTQREAGHQTGCRAARRKIITGVILITLLAVILTVIFVWKRHSDVKGQWWTCSRFRCGEERFPNSLCSCAVDCDQRGDCCTNYRSVCEGERSWLEDKCDDLEAPQCPESFSKPPLLLISLDGFRAGYLNTYGDQLPTINKLRQCGISTQYMRPAYPTKTFPNHYTIVTGLYPESHGIVDNKMYDVNRNAFFSLKDDEKFHPSWYQGEPVWITAMNNNLKSGTYFWPGSDTQIKGKYPNNYKIYNKSIPFEERVMTILSWLKLPPTQRPDFYTLYLDEPDKSGHYYGPNSYQVFDALVRVDQIIGMVMEGLKQQKLHKCVNLVLLSDHGMEEASCEKAAYVSSYQTDTKDLVVIQGPAARIRPKRLPEDFFTFRYEELVKNLSCRAVDQPMKPYLTEHLPKRLHFANNVRIERAHLYMKPGWQAALNPNEVKYCAGGFHGSDNTFTNMQTIFIGYGPGFKSSTVVAPFENIEVYNLLCDLLDIPPAPNNGTHGSLNHLLRNPPHRPVHPAEISLASVCSSGTSTRKHLGCSCALLNESQVENLNRRLNVEHPTAKYLHLPFGAPRVLQEEASYCKLQQSSYISAYSRDVLMPLWVSYTLEPLSAVQPLSSLQEACVRADVRIPATVSQSCSFYKNNPTLTYGFLHPPNFSSDSDSDSDSLVSSNIVPMFPIFKGIWEHFHNVLLVNYSRSWAGVNVITGPIFDTNSDGKYDVMKRNSTDGSSAPLPTHFFVILLSCKNQSMSQRNCKTMSFILPHRPDNTETCHDDSNYSWVQDWCQLHAARIRDIELLSGLSFYPELLPVEESLQLKTFLNTA